MVLISTRHCFKGFTHVKSFNPYSNHLKYMTLYEMIDANQTYCDHLFSVYVRQVSMLCAVNSLDVHYNSIKLGGMGYIITFIFQVRKLRHEVVLEANGIDAVHMSITWMKKVRLTGSDVLLSCGRGWGGSPRLAAAR